MICIRRAFHWADSNVSRIMKPKRKSDWKRRKKLMTNSGNGDALRRVDSVAAPVSLWSMNTAPARLKCAPPWSRNHHHHHQREWAPRQTLEAVRCARTFVSSCYFHTLLFFLRCDRETFREFPLVCPVFCTPHADHPRESPRASAQTATASSFRILHNFDESHFKRRSLKLSTNLLQRKSCHTRWEMNKFEINAKQKKRKAVSLASWKFRRPIQDARDPFSTFEKKQKEKSVSLFCRRVRCLSETFSSLTCRCALSYVPLKRAFINHRLCAESKVGVSFFRLSAAIRRACCTLLFELLPFFFCFVFFAGFDCLCPIFLLTSTRNATHRVPYVIVNILFKQPA